MGIGYDAEACCHGVWIGFTSHIVLDGDLKLS